MEMEMEMQSEPDANTEGTLREKKTLQSLREEGRKFKNELRRMMVRSRGFAALTTGTPVDTEIGNIVGLGYGARETDNDTREPILSVRVYVRSKLPRASLMADELIPASVNGVPTDVIAVGDLRAFSRPAWGGASVGHLLVTAGTLGCLVRKRGGPNDLYILSNNHILANCNAGAPGDAILEPGKIDGGTIPIAELTEFKELKFDDSINRIDAAIARVLDPAEVVAGIRSIGSIPPKPMEAAIYQSVRKSGRTTLHTVGVVKDISAEVNIRYDAQIAHFDDLLSIQGLGGLFSDSGDSGSLVVDGVTRRPVGLLVGGGANNTFVCPIQDVLDYFGVDIVG